MDFSKICGSLYTTNARNRISHGAALKLLKTNQNTNTGITRQYAGHLDGTYYQYPAGGPQACMSNKKEENDFRYK